MTNDVDRRISEHNSDENVKSYTANRRPVELLWSIQLTDFYQAEELEKQIKGWSRKKKEALISGQWDELKVLAACENDTSHKHFERGSLRHPERSRRVNEELTARDDVHISTPLRTDLVEVSTKMSTASDSTNSSSFDSAQDDCLFDSSAQSWQPFFNSEMAKPYYKELQAFLEKRKEEKAIIYPPEEEIFKAFELTPLDKIKVVILGQDPYPNKGDAHGLCFSYKGKKRIPASLNRIFIELNNDLGCTIPKSGDLTKWAENGVFLLNAILTVEHKNAGAHKNRGWETFTNATIKNISDHQDKVVFMLWGSFAQKKETLIDESKHLILKASHPVASVKDGFYTKKMFSDANSFLDVEVDWCL